MMKKLILPLLLLACSRAAAAGSAGADPFNFLFLDAGARPVALGGAYTALARDANALLYNPAGLGEIKEPQAVFMHNLYFQEITQDYLAYASPQGWGLSLNYLNFGTVRRTTVANPTGAGFGSVGLTDLALSAGYGAAIGTDLVAGAGLKYIKESVAGADGQGFGLDLGLLYFPPGLEKAVLGAAVQNIGPDVKFQGDNEKMPLNLRLGAAYRFELKGQASTVSADVTRARGEDTLAGFGLETLIAKAYPLRLGYATRNAAGPGITAGLGYIRGDLTVDYAFVPFGDLGAAHRLSIGYKWGGSARKPAKKAAAASKKTTAADRQAWYEKRVASAKNFAARQNYTAAVTEYKKALALNADDPQTYMALADALMRTGGFKEADNALARAFKLLSASDNNRAYVLERRGAAMLKLAKPGAAKKYYAQAIKIAEEEETTGPALENSYYGLAYCLEKEDRLEEAMRSYKMALQVAGSEALKKQIEKKLEALEPGRR